MWPSKVPLAALAAVTLSLVALSAPALAQAPGPEAPTPATRSAEAAQLSEAELARITAWMECEECENGEMAAVLALGERAAPSLATLLLKGPPPPARETVERHLSKTYRELKAYERTHPKNAISITEDAYVRMYLANFVALYRIRAAKVLGEIGGTDARRALEEARALPLREDEAAAVREALGGK